MKASMVYLGGPIHGRDDASSWEWRIDARKRLGAKNIMSVNPLDNDYRGREMAFMDRLVERDKEWILTCDTMLVNCREPGWGTAMEILFGWEQHKQIIIFGGVTSPWLHYHSNLVVDDLDAAIDSLETGGCVMKVTEKPTGGEPK